MRKSFIKFFAALIVCMSLSIGAMAGDISSGTGFAGDAPKATCSAGDISSGTCVADDSLAGDISSGRVIVNQILISLAGILLGN